MRPSFMPEEVYCGEFTRGQMDKLFCISDMKVTSFIQKCDQSGDSVAYRKPKRYEGFHFGATRVYRCSEVIDRALLDGYEVLPTRVEKLKRSEEDLQRDIELLRKELSVLQNEREDFKRTLRFDSMMSDLGLNSLYTEREIVNSKRTYGGSSGVYFLIKGSKVIYVGQSVNVFARISSHAQYKDFDSYAYVSCAKDRLDILESLYIHTLNPPLQGRNPQNNGCSAPINLPRLLNMGKNA